MIVHERPIPFSVPMVQAVLDGNKSQTRRVLAEQPPETYRYERSRDDWHTGHILRKQPMIFDDQPCWGYGAAWGGQPVWEVDWPSCPYGKPSDVLWVREPWCASKSWDPLKPSEIGRHADILYLADNPLEFYQKAGIAGRYRHARFMCKWMSRLTLKITNVRVERLQDISAEDCIAEGIEPKDLGNAAEETAWVRAEFRRLWESINGPGSWEKNPWLWVVEFERVVAQ